MEGETLRLLNALQIREKAGCHQVLFWGEFLLVPCLFLDCMVILSQDLEKIGEVPFSERTGPRHGVFSCDGKTLYLVSELSNELFALDTGSWRTIFHMSVLPGGLTHRKDTAEIRLNERGDRLYVFTRTMDIVSVIGLEGASPRLLQTVSCSGKHPRDMILGGRHILTANRFTNSVVAFEVREDGTIEREQARPWFPASYALRTRRPRETGTASCRERIFRPCVLPYAFSKVIDTRRLLWYIKFPEALFPKMEAAMKNFTCYVPVRHYKRSQFRSHVGESGGACVPLNKEDIVNIFRASLD